MPVAVAIDRSNNTDSWLVFFLLLAARSALRGRGLSLVVAMALLGVAFNVKMLAALVCGPALLAGWLLAGTLDWRRRLAWMAAAGVTLAVVSLSWAVAFDLTPQDSRPYAGSSHDNSMLELIVVHNGLERFVRPPRTRRRRCQRRRSAPRLRSLRRGAGRPAAAGRAGPRRAVRLDPAAGGAGRRVRLAARDAPSLALWGTWALTYGIVFSAAGGIFHAYYLSALAPPVAALAGIGCFEAVAPRPGASRRSGLAAAALWQGYIAGASLGWDVDLDRLPRWWPCWRAPPTLWRDKRPPAVDRRRRPAGPADRRGRSARSSRRATSRCRRPAWRAGSASTTAAARCCRATTARSATIPSCGRSCRNIAARRASCWPRPTPCWPRR